MPVGRWGSDMPAKMAENLQIDLLATFETYVIPVSEGGIAGEILKNIVGIIVGDAVSVMLLATEPLLLAEAVEGYFSLKVAEYIGENLSK